MLRKSGTLGLAILIAVLVFGLDFLSKFLTHHYIPLMNSDSLWYPYGGIGVFKNFFGIEFSISHTTNRGAAWGAFANYQQQLLYLRLVLVTGMVMYLLFFNKNQKLQIPFALIIAGALGNICDYFLYGQVVDMFHFVFWGYDYPVFNVADAAIFVGIAWLVILSFFDGKKK
jgi:signal peptidase II